MKLVELEELCEEMKFHSVAWAMRKVRHRGWVSPKVLVSGKKKKSGWCKRKVVFERTMSNRQKYWECWRQSLKKRDQKWFAATEAQAKFCPRTSVPSKTLMLMTACPILFRHHSCQHVLLTFLSLLLSCLHLQIGFSTSGSLGHQLWSEVCVKSIRLVVPG